MPAEVKKKLLFNEVIMSQMEFNYETLKMKRTNRQKFHTHINVVYKEDIEILLPNPGIDRRDHFLFSFDFFPYIKNLY